MKKAKFLLPLVAVLTMGSSCSVLSKVTTKLLSAALNDLDSYKMTLSVSSLKDSSSDVINTSNSYYYDDGKLMFQDKNKNFYYLEEKDNLRYLTFNCINNKFYTINERDSHYDELLYGISYGNYIEFNVNDLLVEDFKPNKTYFIVEDEKLQDVGTKLLNDASYAYTSIELTTQFTNLKTVTVTASKVVDSIQVDYVFEANFDALYFGQTHFSIPESTYGYPSGGGSSDDTPGGDPTVVPTKETNATKMKDVAHAKGFRYGFASTGDVKALVLPISFTNKSFPTDYKSKLEIAFNGTSAQTGWESLHSYYSKTSYGKLNITADIQDEYRTGSQYKFSENINNYPDEKWLAGAIKQFDSSINYKDYDSNNDGRIDCIYVIYSAPYDSEGDSDLWWAYTTQVESSTATSLRVDGMQLDYFIFMSYDFFLDAFEDGSKTTVNCETLIHETGHAFGINDYYDYEEGKGANYGAGGGMMMDYNVGDHDPYSKALMGWADPYILASNKSFSNVEVSLGKFESTGDSLLIPYNWQGSYYTEYFIIDYYSPTGLNAKQKGHSGLPSREGIRIFHINSTLASGSVNDPYSATKYDNTETNPVLIRIESGGTVKSNGSSTNKNILTAGSTFTGSWYNASSKGITVKVGSIFNGVAKVTVSATL